MGAFDDDLDRASDWDLGLAKSRKRGRFADQYRKALTANVWIDRGQKRTPIKDMSDVHLRNTIGMLSNHTRGAWPADLRQQFCLVMQAELDSRP